ncbi:MAG: mechanosensitive ion channel family protein [Gemmatimonadetes bacterium]|nr:mechanosensitive ion channel family protein [Gemmatimonadota bacterium]
MPEAPAFLDVLRGSGAGYGLAAACVLGLLVLRGASPDPQIRRRALIATWVFVLFALLRLPLLALSPTTGDLEGKAAANPAYQVLDVISLAVFAYALIQALLLFLVDEVLVRRFRIGIPRILSDVALIAIFLVAVMAILYYQTDLDVTGIFTTAGVLSLVIGLALQDTLGNVFAGLALQTERPFNVGDWISFGTFEGMVADVSWRSTQFRTRNGDLVTVPNSTLSKETFVNHSAPTRVSGRLVEIGVGYQHAPAHVKRVLLAACAEVPQILEQPEPLVRLKTFGDFAITYEVKYWITDFAAMLDIDESYRTLLWYVFRREGIEIPFPIQVQYEPDVPKAGEERERAAEHVLERLRGVEFLSALNEDELRRLCRGTQLHDYYTGETVCRQGDDGDTFFIIDDGSVVVSVTKGGRQEEVARLSSPAFFGEMALLTGEQRTATVRAATSLRLLAVDRDAFRSIIVANPDLATSMSEILARRQVELVAKHAALDESLAASHEETSRQILARIRGFFGFRTEPRPLASGARSAGARP